MPSLDGWRAIAVLGVMLTHDKAMHLFGFTTADYKGLGGLGIYLFFAISGFLITTRILEEERIVGKFNIQRFYIRRIFRIQPAALAYLAFVALLMLTGLGPPEWYEWWGAIFLFLNYAFHPPGAGAIVGHFWTLAVEEHFYILLSLTLLVFRRNRALILFLLFAAFTAFTLAASDTTPARHAWYNPVWSPRATQWHINSLLLASLIAVLVRMPPVLKFVRTVLRPWVAFPLTLLLVLAYSSLYRFHTHQPADLGDQATFLATYLFALWVVPTVFHPRSWTTRFLETKPLRFVGKISYSLYLWHVAFFYIWDKWLFPPTTSCGRWALLFLDRPGKWAISFGLAVLSYYFIEKPLIRKGHRLAPPATPGRLELADLPVEAPQITPEGA